MQLFEICWVVHVPGKRTEDRKTKQNTDFGSQFGAKNLVLQPPFPLTFLVFFRFGCGLRFLTISDLQKATNSGKVDPKRPNIANIRSTFGRFSITLPFQGLTTTAFTNPPNEGGGRWFRSAAQSARPLVGRRRVRPSSAGPPCKP